MTMYEWGMKGMYDRRVRSLEIHFGELKKGRINQRKGLLTIISLARDWSFMLWFFHQEEISQSW